MLSFGPFLKKQCPLLGSTTLESHTLGSALLEICIAKGILLHQQTQHILNGPKDFVSFIILGTKKMTTRTYMSKSSLLFVEQAKLHQWEGKTNAVPPGCSPLVGQAWCKNKGKLSVRRRANSEYDRSMRDCTFSHSLEFHHLDKLYSSLSTYLVCQLCGKT